MTFSFTMTGMCNCGALAATANAMGYPPSHGPDCPQCRPTERWLKLRICELEAERARAHAEGKAEGEMKGWAGGLREAAEICDRLGAELNAYMAGHGRRPSTTPAQAIRSLIPAAPEVKDE